MNDFYLSISKELLTNALKLGEAMNYLYDNDQKIVGNFYILLLFNQHQTLIKKQVTCLMFVWAPTTLQRCANLQNFFVVFVRTTIQQKAYRDNGLALFKNCSGLQIKKIKKLPIKN